MKRTKLTRKTPLEPGKGIKRGGKIRKKRRPRDSAMWTNKQWRDECDKVWPRIIKLKAMRDRPDCYCAVCATLPPAERVSATQWHAHHLISCERMFFRHSQANGICLCNRHHNNDAYLSAHGAPWAFQAWFKKHEPEQYQWWLKNRNECYKGAKINYRQVHSVLVIELKLLDAFAEGDSDE